MSMTPRQRWLALFNRQEPDRVPTDYWATPEFDARLKADLGIADDETLWRRLHIDHRRFFGPRALREHHPNDAQADLWGIRYEMIDYGTGAYREPVHHPLADVRSVAEVHAHRWPTTDDFDYSAVSEALDRDDGYRLRLGGYFEPFLLYGYMRGLEQAFEDLALNPEIADAILGHLFDFHYQNNAKIFEAAAGRLDVINIAEDLGSQTGPLMSLEHYRRFLLPNQRKMADLARSHGLKIMYHTDGAARPFLPDLIEVVGIDMLDPIQWRCPGMDREGLVRDFGKRIAFHGGMDNQQTLPFGTVADVVAEVKENLAIFAGARYVCGPCHAIQPVTPTANVVAMYETLVELAEGRAG